MGNFFTEIISSDGIEKDFIGVVYDYITDLWSNITCQVYYNGEYVSDDPDDMAYGSTIVSEMRFVLDTDVILGFQAYPNIRSGVGYAANAGYNVYLKCGNITAAQKGSGYTTQMKGTCLRNKASDSDVSTSASRQYRMSKYVDNNIFILWIGPYDAADFKNTNGLAIMKFKVTESGVEKWKWAAYTGPNIIENASVYNADGTNSTIKSSMFSYEARTGYLDFISHSNFITGSTKAFTSTDIYDCTTVNFGDTLSLKDGANFLAIGAHSMVPINDEEE